METLRLADDLELTRMGYGALALSGPRAWGPPRDRSAAIAVLREAVERGVNHIDTSDYYGPHTVNEVIREALHPYPEQLRIVTKVGARRSADRAWPAALSRSELVSAVEDNLRNLGLEALDLVNLRVGTERHGPDDKSIAEPFTVLAELRQAGKIRHLGVSNVTAAQLAQAQQIAPVRTVQNRYSVANRHDDALVEACARQGISFVGFSGSGFAPVQSEILEAVATRLGASVQQVMLAWLLQRTPTTLVIPTTSSVAHLHDNLAAAELILPPDAVADLDTVGIR
jgi:aryl-alcohol dehydrogenase-like predicted oxidoreductase